MNKKLLAGIIAITIFGIFLGFIFGQSHPIIQPYILQMQNFNIHFSSIIQFGVKIIVIIAIVKAILKHLNTELS